MILEISYLPGAVVDFDNSFEWYAERSQATAERFTKCIDDALRRIVENPGLFMYVIFKGKESAKAYTPTPNARAIRVGHLFLDPFPRRLFALFGGSHTSRV